MLELINEKKRELLFVRDKLNYLLGTQNTLKEERKQKSESLEKAKHMIDVYSKVVLLLQGASENARHSIVSRIEKIVTEALHEIIPNENLSFKVIFESKRGASEVTFKLFDETIKQELNVMYSYGGGIKDIISTVLRIVVIELDRTKCEGPIILDETGKNVSVEYQENFGRFLRILSEKLGKQIILITHEDNIVTQAHKVFQIAKKDGKSYIEVS